MAIERTTLEPSPTNEHGNWHGQAVAEVVGRLRTDPRRGLTIEEAARRIDRLMTECLPDVSHRTCLIERGDPSPVILAQALAQTADLIVLGKQGRSRAEELFLGSVTRHILAGSTCDVLVVSP